MTQTENTISVSEKARVKLLEMMAEKGNADDASWFLRVSVVGGGCSGLSYKLDFDNKSQPGDQVFDNDGVAR